jgi:outer membrane protein OmpA-like peptidoglycan-associated protein
VEFTVAMRGMKDAINTAQAFAPGNVASNEARSLVRMNEELFSQKGFIVGRVFEGNCDSPGREDAGVAGIRIYLEDGRYGVTDENGRFHFEGLEPGTHSVQLDKLTLPEYLELAPCVDRMGHAGRDYSQFAELRGGTLWRSDFVLRQKAPPKGDVQFEFSSSLLPDDGGDGPAAHQAVVRVGGVTVGNTRAMVMLPAGFEYVPGSATVDGNKVTDAKNQVIGAGDPVVSLMDGVVVARLGELPAGAVRTIRFETRSTPAAGGALTVRALAMFDSPAKSGLRTQPIESQLNRGAARYGRSQFSFTPRFDVLKTELALSDEAALRNLINSWRGARDITIRAVGHADSQQITARSRKVYADNYALSKARAQTVANYLAISLNVPESRVHVEGHGSDEPVNTGMDAASLAANRRVEIVIEGARFEANAPLELVKAGGEPQKIETVGVVLRGPGSASARSVRNSVNASERTGTQPIDINALSPGIRWLTPEADSVPAISSIKIAIAHDPKQTAELALNGVPVNKLNYDGASFNDAGTVALSRWRGVDLVDGDNELSVKILDTNGDVVWTAKRTVHYGGSPVRAEIDKEASKLVADGRTRPVIALRMFDKYGKPARSGTIANFGVDSPYRSWWEVEQLNDNQILSTGSREPQVEVRENGLALIELEPTTVSGNAVVRLRFNERQSDEYKVWLEPAARDWILVGIAEGTAAYNTISGNMETASAADREDGFQDGGRVAFFAKGRIKGDFLLTMAYDSAREKKDARTSTRILMVTLLPLLS